MIPPSQRAPHPLPRVTIITPCYNAVTTLPALLESIDSQVLDAEHAPFSLSHIVYDAGSTDGSRALLLHHQRPWRTLLFEDDKGPADAINKGFSRASTSSDYLAWLNADDAYAPQAIARAIATLEAHPRASFAFGHCPILDAHNREIRRPITRFKELFFPFPYRWVLQTLNFVSQPATLFRTSAIQAASIQGQTLRLDLKAAWDYDLLLRLLHQGPCVRIPGSKPIAFFRWTPSSISGSHFHLQFQEELDLACADAGPFSLPALLHRLVRFGIVSIYSRMTRHSAR